MSGDRKAATRTREAMGERRSEGGEMCPVRTCTILFRFWQKENGFVLTGQNAIAKANETFPFCPKPKQNSKSCRSGSVHKGKRGAFPIND